MNASRRDPTRCFASGLLLLALISSISSFGHGTVSIGLPVQHDSLALTINPDRSIGVTWNTTRSLGTLAQNITKYFVAGYTIHSSSNFSQQSNDVVQTSTTTYQLPPPDAGIFNSISLTATRTGFTSSGSLTITTNVPASTITAIFSSSPLSANINATAQLHFSQTLYRGTFLANRTAFQAAWNRTFGNVAWSHRIVQQIENATLHFVTVTSFNSTVTYPTSTSATVKIGFVTVPSQTGSDFVTVLEVLLLPIGEAGLDPIIRSALNLQTGETVNLTYNGSTYTVTLQSTTTYVGDLDSQVNMLKSQFLQPLLGAFPAGTPYASLAFLNATAVTVSQISTTSNLDLAAGTSSMSLRGLILKPPTVGSSVNFTIPGLFKTIEETSAPGVNLTLVGGSDGTDQVKIVVPSSAPQPSSATPNSATWTNLGDASRLSAVEFQLQPVSSSSSLAFLASPLGLAIEAIVAIAIFAGIILYVRRRAVKASLPGSASGPTPVPGFGLGPAPAPA